MSSETPSPPERPEQQGLTVADYLEILRRRKWELIWPAVLLFSIVAVVAAVLPNKYTSMARILVEHAEIPDEFVRTTVLAGTRQQLGATT